MLYLFYFFLAYVLFYIASQSTIFWAFERRMHLSLITFPIFSLIFPSFEISYFLFSLFFHNSSPFWLLSVSLKLTRVIAYSKFTFSMFPKSLKSTTGSSALIKWRVPTPQSSILLNCTRYYTFAYNCSIPLVQFHKSSKLTKI